MVPAITQKELEQYLLQSLNMALGSVLQGETSYTNSFDISVKENGFIFHQDLSLMTNCIERFS